MIGAAHNEVFFAIRLRGTPDLWNQSTPKSAVAAHSNSKKALAA